MDTSKIESNKSSNDSEKAEDSSVDNSEKKDTGRRIQDVIGSKSSSRKLNLDRRIEGSDRRVNTDPNYKGPPRRDTIDRRLTIKDRRQKD